MASRAPALAKPKPKAKLTTKSSATKTAVVKSSLAKGPIVKNAISQNTVIKSTAAAKSTVVKNASPKASLVKAAGSSKTSGTKTLSAVDASPVKALKHALQPAVKSKLNKTAESAMAMDPKSGKTLLAKPLALKTPAALDDVAKIVGKASFEPAVPKPRRRTKGEIRTRIYWAVFNQSLRRVAVFEFDQRGEAEKRADKLAKASGEHHFIQKIKAIVQ